MAQIPPINSLNTEDYPDQQEWIGKLVSPINLFMTSVVNALSQNLAFGANIQGQEYLLQFVYQSSADLPQNFRVTLPVRPQALYLVSAYENSLPVALIPSWQLTADGQCQITSLTKVSSSGVSGLTVGASYAIKFRITP